MRKVLLFPLVLFFLKSNLVFCQPTLPEFGEFTDSEKNLKECDFDKDADAVILFDYGNSVSDDEQRLITTQRIRIKILNNRGLDYANIRIPFYSKEDFEYVHNISGLAYTPDEKGNYSVYTLDKRSIFTEKEDNYYSAVKFAMPNVKAGSIIEYKYEKVSKNYSGLERWLFQSDIPTLKSGYLLQVPGHLEFAYTVQKKTNYPIVIKPITDAGEIYFEMNNIPGLKFEPYMDAVKDYLQRVEFQLSGYVTSFGNKQNVNTTWREVAFELASSKDLGSVKKNLSSIDDVKALAEKETTATGKLTAIYNYVRKNMTWNGYDSKYAGDGIRSAWEKKNGTAAEINLILLSLLETFNIEAYPLLVAERDFGRVDTTFPLLDGFNKTAVYAIADNNTFILDATQNSCPPQLVPYSLLNTEAFLIDRKKYRLFRVVSPATFKNQTKIIASINEKGILKGNAMIVSNDYAKQFYSEEIRKDEKKFVSKTFQEPYELLRVDSFNCENLKNDAEPLIQDVKFTNELSESGGFLLLNYNLFTGLEKNPFVKPERFTNIDFGFPYMESTEEEIELPSSAKVDDLPANKKLVTPSREISVLRNISRDGNKLHVRIDFIQTLTLVSYEDYETLRKFYRSMVEMLNEPIVIKLSK